jgi:hypothetical protein
VKINYTLLSSSDSALPSSTVTHSDSNFIAVRAKSSFLLTFQMVKNVKLPAANIN